MRAGHVVFAPKTSALRCRHCGEEYALAMPCPLSIAAAASKAFVREHKGCRKPEKLFFEAKIAAPGGTVEERAQRWITSDDTGLSSETIWNFFMSGGRGRISTPSDPGDFGRCHRLLALIPEWRQRLGEVARLSDEWAALVGGWSELEALYERDLPTGKSMDLWRRMDALTGVKP